MTKKEVDVRIAEAKKMGVTQQESRFIIPIADTEQEYTYKPEVREKVLHRDKSHRAQILSLQY